MKRTLISGAAVVMLIAVPATADVAPQDVVYADGAIEESLTGVPGNPENGEKVMTTAALGNCVACHASTALKQYPFHGNIGPDLDGAADRWTEAELRGIVANAKMTFDQSFMPAFYKSSGYIRPGEGYKGTAGAEPLPPILSAQQVEDVVAFLMTFKE